MPGDLAYFSHARTAMKYGLELLDFCEGDRILLPEFICDVVLHPLDDLNIGYDFYSINDDLSPQWDGVERTLTPKTKAIMMVHYFGQPQNIEDFKIFCKKHGLYLIEDNAHGHGGTFNDKPLGSFGDIGFSSPRKQLLSASGGILYLGGNIEQVPKMLSKFPVVSLKERSRRIVRQFPHLKSLLRKMIRKEPIFSDPYSFPEIKISDYCADDVSVKMINDEDWNQQARLRRDAWRGWRKFAVNHGLRPIWDNVHPKSSPWALPVYAKNKEERLYWLHDGWIKGYDTFPWPTLPDLVKQRIPSASKRWERLLCFPLHHKVEDFEAI